MKSYRFPKIVALVLALVTACGCLSACKALYPTPVVAPTPTAEPARLPPPLEIPPLPIPNRPAGYTGWVIVAYPDMTYEQMVGAVRRMKEAGANVVWIAHANPARPFKLEREVGLNPSVFWAFRDPAQLAHQDSIEIVQAVERMLRACREAGVKAVLSVGYQTQMGEDWNRRHLQDLRRQADGSLWKITPGNDPYASVYSPAFRTDLDEYYVWIEYQFINPFRDVILMLNLADEPLGGDYSGWAAAEFRQRNNFGFEEVGNNPGRQQVLGRFQAGVVADFMKLAASLWQRITPGLPVTMSFDGGAMREDNGFPNLELLFAQAPANFVLTWDMYPRDRGTLSVGLNETDITRLFLLARAIAGYSAQYDRKVWLWSAANSWGLGQQVSEPGTIGDAQANLLYLALLMNQAGGRLEGMAVWNYNVKTQGLYNYSWGTVQQKASWNEDQMFERVSAQFGPVRRLMAANRGGPQVLLLRPPEWQYQEIGASGADYFKPQIDYGRMDILARNNVAQVEAGHWPDLLPAGWENLKMVMVLTPAAYLNDTDWTALRNWTAQGGTLVAPIGVVETLTGRTVGRWNDRPTAQPFQKGRIFASREPVFTLFYSGDAGRLESFWRELFGWKDYLKHTYALYTAEAYLHYSLSNQAELPPWPQGWSAAQRFRANGTAQLFNQAGWPAWPLQRSEFVFASKN